MTKRKRNIILGAIGVAIIVFAISMQQSDVIQKSYVVVPTDFESIIVAKGQMKSQSYVKINLPEVMMDRELSLHQLVINDLVAEGTKVQKGDYVALLDQERIKGELNNVQDRLLNYENQLNLAVIDSVSDLTSRRNAIKEMEYDLEYKNLEIKQSIYESQSYQDKTKRQYGQASRQRDIAQRDYQRAILNHKRKCSKYELKVDEYSKRLEKLYQAIEAATITAPQDGMIIYAESWGGKRKQGDQVSMWSPEIAVLPDLNKLVSDTYIEEVDMSKVNIGCPVRVKVDALPDNVFMGNVIKMANIGKSISGEDSKVFDISIKIEGNDPKVAHGMNTTNEIIIKAEQSALTVPLNFIYSEKEGTVVYMKEDKQLVPHRITYKYSNTEVALIQSGVKEGDQLYLRPRTND